MHPIILVKPSAGLSKKKMGGFLRALIYSGIMREKKCHFYIFEITWCV